MRLVPVIVLVLGWAGVAMAQDAKTIAAAEAEGSLVIYSQPNLLAQQYVQREWTKLHPTIGVTMTVMPSSQFVVRFRTERQSGKFFWDIGFAGGEGGYILSKEGAIDPFLPELVDPGVNDPAIWGGWDEAFVDVAKKYVFAMSRYIRGPWYNAAFVAPEKVASQGLKVMLDPAYKGKTMWNDPLVPGTGQTQALVMRRELGDEGLKQLVIDQKMVFVQQQQQVVEAMARGTAWIGLGAPVKGLIQPYLQAGVKADIRSFGTKPNVNIESIGGSTLYVFEHRPHPNATRLFINWILSEKVQADLGKLLDQDSRRRDVPPTADADETAIPGAKYYAFQREEYLSELKEAVELIRQLRQQAQ